MSGSFLTIAGLMSLLAFSFIAFPYFRSGSQNSRGFAQWPLLTVVFVIIFAVGMYLALGKPDAASYVPQHAIASQAAPRSTAIPTHKKSVASVGSMVAGLAERLEREPGDTGGWILLAKSYQHLGQAVDARAAYARAKELGGSDPALDKSLAPTNAASASSAEIRGKVSIAAEAAAGLGDTDTVFVVAKAAGGAPMPLAVVRRNASELPFEFVLDDETSMVPGMNLSSAGKVIVSAKISRSGDALQTEPGYSVESDAIDAKDSDFLELVIDPASHAIDVQTTQAETEL